MKEKGKSILPFLFLAAAASTVWLSAGGAARAHERRYVWTYEYATAVDGERELEYYLTNEVPDTSHSDIDTWKHWFEFEYGITNHWDISFYQMFRQTNNEDSSTFRYDGFKVRTRYRFGEEGTYPVDPLLYLEFIKAGHSDNEDALELKLILARTFGRWNISYNQILERELESDGETEHEYALGTSVELTRHLLLGLESRGNFTEQECSAGPTLAMRTNGNWWITVGALFGLNAETDDLQARAILAIEF